MLLQLFLAFFPWLWALAVLGMATCNCPCGASCCFTCPACHAIPANWPCQWTLTISGYTNSGSCATCTNLNGSYTLTMVNTSLWAGTNASGATARLSVGITWTFGQGCNPGDAFHANLCVTDNLNCAFGSYSLSLSEWSCCATNTLLIDVTGCAASLCGHGGGVCSTNPSTLNVVPVTPCNCS